MKKNIAFLGVFLALALIFSYVESMIPIPFMVPGIKLGLTNIVIIIILYCMGAKQAYTISIARVILAGFMFGNMAMIPYGLAGAVLSLTVMVLLKRTGRLKIISISTIGGICHNIGQMIIAALAVETFSLLYYLPVLLIAGFITGLVIGIAAQEVTIRIQKFFVTD